MDIVITYVDGLDPLWQRDYEATVGKQIIEKRFRDWGTLPYLFRGIEKNMPEVGTVHLVVARESQVPEWVNRDEVNVVLHSEIIPQDKLPVFNSPAIEMFLHRIQGLSERFVYFNDDCFPVLPLSIDELYEAGRPFCHMAKHLFTFNNEFRVVTRRSCNLARKAAGKLPSLIYLRPQHTIRPMLRSACEEMFAKAEKEILASITAVRENCNYNQYIFADYTHFRGRSTNKRISNRHFSLAAAGIDKIQAFLEAPTKKLVCINDVQMSDEKFQTMRDQLLESFEKMFQEKSRYEL